MYFQARTDGYFCVDKRYSVEFLLLLPSAENSVGGWGHPPPTKFANFSSLGRHGLLMYDYDSGGILLALTHPSSKHKVLLQMGKNCTVQSICSCSLTLYNLVTKAEDLINMLK